MRIIRGGANVVPDAILTAIETMVCSTCDIDGIDEAVLAEGIGKVPEGFFVAGGDEVELVNIHALLFFYRFNSCSNSSMVGREDFHLSDMSFSISVSHEATPIGLLMP